MEISPKDLRQVVVFENATDDDLKLILQNSITRSIEESSFFFFQGDAAEYMYILTSGQALENSTALAFSSKFLHSMLEKRPYLSFDLMKLMTSYIQEMHAWHLNGQHIGCDARDSFFHR